MNAINTEAELSKIAFKNVRERQSKYDVYTINDDFNITELVALYLSKQPVLYTESYVSTRFDSSHESFLYSILSGHDLLCHIKSALDTNFKDSKHMIYHPVSDHAVTINSYKFEKGYRGQYGTYEITESMLNFIMENESKEEQSKDIVAVVYQFLEGHCTTSYSYTNEQLNSSILRSVESMLTNPIGYGDFDYDIIHIKETDRFYIIKPVNKPDPLF